MKMIFWKSGELYSECLLSCVLRILYPRVLNCNVCGN